MRQIYLFTTVDEFSAQMIVSQLLDYDRQSNDEITMFINSPGGSVTQLFSIIDAMDLIKSPIRTVVIGQAASCAAVIAAYGDTRLITEKSEFMLHEVWQYMVGSYSDFDESFKRMDDKQNKLLSILSSSTGKTVDQLKAIIKKNDVYYTADQAVAFGLADRVIKPAEAQLFKLSEAIQIEGSEISLMENGLTPVEILKTGEFQHPTYGKIIITEQALNGMVENFNNRVRGVDISFDYTHDNENGESPAAFWVKALQVKSKDDCKVLVAQAEFTPKGKKAIQEKEFKYSSSDFCMDYANEQGKHFAYVLRGGTLTNRPFIKGMDPIKLSEFKPLQKGNTEMNREQMIAALKAEHNIDVAGLQSQNTALNSEITALKTKFSELAALPAQKDAEIKVLNAKITELNDSIVAQGKEKAFDTLMEARKVTPAQKDKIIGLFDSGEKMLEFYKDAPVVVAKEAKGDNGEEDVELTEAEKEVVASGKQTKDEVVKYRQPGKRVKKQSK